MATLYWVGGSGSQSWAAAANWATFRNGTGGSGPPVTGDTVYVIDGTSVIDQGMNQSAVTLAALYIGFNGVIGSQSSGLDIDAGTCSVFGSPQAVYFYGAISSTLQIYVNSGSFVRFDSNGGGAMATNTYIGNAGRVVIGSSCDLEACFLWCFGATVEIENSGDLDPDDNVDAYIHGGTVISYRRTGSVDIYSGSYTVNGTVAVSDIDVYAGGVYTHQSSGLLGTINVWPGGVASTRRATSPFTVTNSTVYGNGSLFDQSPVVITKTNPTTYICPQ